MNPNWSQVIDLVSKQSFCHVSFDFWNTIAFSNPKFKEQRLDYLRAIFENKYSKDIIQDHLKDCAAEYNHFIEVGNVTKVSQVLYGELFQKISGKKPSETEMSNFTMYVNELFCRFPPTLSADIVLLLKWLKQTNCSVSITSNTAYVSGITITQCLHNWGIINFFDFCIFSDEFGFAKPAPQIYIELLRLVGLRHGEFEVNRVLHIGDNFTNDILGARVLGIDTFKV